MKMYDINLIMELIHDAMDCGDALIGFEFDEENNISLCFKEAFVGNPCLNEITVLEHVEYYVAAEPPVRCGESHHSGQTEPPCY